MVFKRATLLIGAALVLGSAQGALAADLGNYGGGGSLKDGYVAQVEPSHRSWYVRIDGGYSWNGAPDISEDQVSTYCGVCVVATTFDLTNTKFDNTWSFGGGVGMHFSNRIRGDITYDHRFSGDVSGDLTGGNLDGTRNFSLESDVVLANLYYDFDLGRRFTPYIGGGIGFAHHNTGSGTVDTCGCTIGTIDSGSNTDFAAALMAGVSIDLWGGQQVVAGGGMKDGPMYVDTGRKLALDIGYRFLWLGDAETGAVNGVMVGGTVSDDPTVHDIHAHELRIGLRYDIN
jgi:opacity protein-like surface antigen